jgi:uncharacterized protein YdgA (DUF945 family)
MGITARSVGIGMAFVLGTGAMGTYLAAKKAERLYDATLAEANRSELLHFSRESYERGLLHSRATTLVTLNRDHVQVRAIQQAYAGKTLPDLRMVLSHEIEHNPVRLLEGAPTFMVVTRLDEQDSGQAQWLERSSATHPLQAVTRVTVNGDSSTTLDFLPLRYRTPDDSLDIDWRGLHGVLNITDHRQQFDALLESPGMHARLGPATLEFGALRMEIDARLGSFDFFTGTEAVTLEGVQIAAPDAEGEERVTGFGRLVLHGEARENEALLSTRSSVRITEIQADDHRLPLFSVDMAADNIAMEPLAVLREQMIAIRDNPALAEQHALMLRNQIMSRITEMLSSRPRLRVPALVLETEWGGMKGSLDLTTAGAVPRSANPAAWLQALHGNAYLTVSEDLFDLLATGLTRANLVSQYQAMENSLPPEGDIDAEAAKLVKQQIQLLESRGMVVREGGQIRIEVVIDQGEILINGVPLWAMPVNLIQVPTPPAGPL